MTEPTPIDDELTFTVASQTYSVKTWHDEHTCFVRAFKNDLPVNGFMYQVAFEGGYEDFVKHGSPGLEVLIEQATADIHDGRIYPMETIL